MSSPAAGNDGALDDCLWVVRDANYNVTAIFDNSGNVVERYIHDPFGQVTVLTASWAVRSVSAYAWLHLHQGGRFDPTTGLYHFRHRDYSPTLGRWTTNDPIGFQAGDVNLYRSVGNSPTNSTDPSGLIAPLLLIIVGGAAGAGFLFSGYAAVESYRATGTPFSREIWGAAGKGLRIGGQANVNALATAGRSMITLGAWSEPWEVWSVDPEDRRYYDGSFLASRFGWELLATAGVGRLTQAPGRMGRWGRYVLYWDAAQNTVQVGRGSWDICNNGLDWGNGLQVSAGLLGLGGNYTTWRRLRGNVPNQVLFHQIPEELPLFDPRGTLGAAKAWTIKGHLKAAQLPIRGKIRYVPPEGYTPGRPLPRGPNGGYLDRFGNEWLKGPSRTPGQPFEWDVQIGKDATPGFRALSKDGRHVNVSLDGEVTH